jgi:hypothetical protein
MHANLDMQAREAVLEEAEWFVYSHLELLAHLRRYTVCVIGSGAWATAAARIVAQNTLAFDPADEFTDEVKMWVYEEDFEVCCSFSCARSVIEVLDCAGEQWWL